MKRIVALAALFASCRETPKAAQVILYVDTDAPIGVTGTGGIHDPIPLFDRIRFDVLAPGSSQACPGCTNEFEVTASQFANRTVSIGIPAVGGGYRLRVRLFRSVFAQAGEPDALTTIDETFVVPTVPPDTSLELTAHLDTDRIGVPTGVDVPLAMTPGKPLTSRVGQWPRASRAPCVGGLASDEACVPGGAFWMGAAPGPATETTEWHRLVVLSPFIVKTHEVTVAEFHDAGFNPTLEWSGSHAGTDLRDWCTGAQSPDDKHKPLPVNCVTWDIAQQYCAKRNQALPTEAQFAYLAGGLRGLPFLWGTDAPTCSSAVWGRLGFGLTTGSKPSVCRGASNYLGEIGGPDPPGSAKLDRLELETGTITDIAGNLVEWVRDHWQARSGACWTAPLLVDPFCQAAGDDTVYAGGGWPTGIESLLSWSREHIYFNTASPSWGFRCVRPSE